MSNLTWLHLSDLHILPTSNDAYYSDKVLKALLETLKTGKEKPELIFITGDIINCGSIDYKRVKSFFDKLLDVTELKSKLGEQEAKKRLFIVPGNHDVDRAKKQILCRTLNSQDEAIEFFNPQNIETREPYFKRFHAYEEFFNDYFNGIRVFNITNHYYTDLITMEDISLSIGVIGLNSCWFAQGPNENDDSGKLWIGERTLATAFAELNSKGKTDIIIILFHHPLSWLHPNEMKNITESLTKNANILLYGHIHDNNTEDIKNQNGRVLKFQAGSAYGDNKHPHRVLWGFIDVHNATVTIKPIMYQEGLPGNWTLDPSLYKDNHTHYTETYDIPDMVKYIANSNIQTEENKSEVTIEIQKKKLYDNLADTKYNSSLNNTKELPNDDKETALLKIQHLQNNATPDWVKLWHYTNLPNEEFKYLLNKVSTSFQNKEHSEIGIILHITSLLLHFSKIGFYNKDKECILQEAKEYVDLLKVNNQLNFNIDLLNQNSYGSLIFIDKDLKEFKDFLNYIKNKVAEAKAESLPIAGIELLEIMEKDVNTFCKMIYLNNYQEKNYYDTPIFKYINPIKFVETFLSITNENRNKIILAFEKRYESNRKLVDELYWLKNVRDLIVEELKNQGKELSVHLLKQIITNYIDKFINNLEMVNKETLDEPVKTEPIELLLSKTTLSLEEFIKKSKEATKSDIKQSVIYYLKATELLNKINTNIESSKSTLAIDVFNEGCNLFKKNQKEEAISLFINVIKIDPEFKEGKANIEKNDKTTLLHLAVTQNNKELVKLFLANKANINKQTSGGDTPLHLAAHKNYKDIVELLIKNEAELNIKNNNGDTPLHLSASENFLESAKLLIENKVDINAKNNSGDTPLNLSMIKHYGDITELLVKNGAKGNNINTPINIKDIADKSPIEIEKILGVPCQKGTEAYRLAGKETPSNYPTNYYKDNTIKIIFIDNKSAHIKIYNKTIDYPDGILTFLGLKYEKPTFAHINYTTWRNVEDIFEVKAFPDDKNYLTTIFIKTDMKYA